MTMFATRTDIVHTLVDDAIGANARVDAIVAITMHSFQHGCGRLIQDADLFSIHNTAELMNCINDLDRINAPEYTRLRQNAAQTKKAALTALETTESVNSTPKEELDAFKELQDNLHAVVDELIDNEQKLAR